MNWVELVQRHWPNLDQEAASMLLWSATCFPMGDADTIEQQIKEAYIKSHGDVGLAIAQVEDEMYEEFKKHKVMEVLKNG
jgi:RNase P/RNase MRP subunit POP5